MKISAATWISGSSRISRLLMVSIGVILALLFSLSSKVSGQVPYITPATNLTKGTSIRASSTISGNFTPQKAVDGDETSDFGRWMSTPSDNQWLEVDLGSIQQVSSIKILWAGDTTKDYDVQTSNDGSTFTTVASGSTNNQLFVLGTHSLNNQNTRFIRILCKNRWNASYGNSIREIGVYLTETQTEPPPTGTQLVHLKFEAENYTDLSGNVAKISGDTTASGGQYIEFSGSTTPPPTTSRDAWYRPFASTSIWNMPIGSNAIYKNTGYPVHTNNSYDAAYLIKTVASDPIKTLRPPYDWRDRCNLASQPVSSWTTHFPNNYTASDAFQDSNGSWNTPNRMTAVLQPDGRTIANISVLCRDIAGGEVYGYLVNRTDIYGDGILGSHGASKLSVLGGAIRPGELTNDTPINHVLDLVLYAKYASYAANADGKCYRWPASSCDSYANDPGDGLYEYNVPGMTMGSLLAIPPSVTPASINVTSKAGLKLFYAMQNYGGYFTEDSYWAANYLVIDNTATSDISAFQNTTTRSEFGRIINAAKFIDNNSPSSIGGGGTPRAPLLPPLP